MKSSYKKEDIDFLLTDLTDLYLENNIKNAIKEYEMSKEYLNFCIQEGKKYVKQTAIAVGNLAEQIYKYKSENVVLVSIIRSGIPIGILVKRYLEKKYKKKIFHYAISIKNGIDKVAMNYIISKHFVKDIQFIDSWIGKGTVTKTINDSATEFPGLDSSLAVLCDAINITKYCGIRGDIAIPQAPINACITGLVSIPISDNSKTCYDGAIYLDYLESQDVSQKYIDLIEKEFDYNCDANNYLETLNECEEIQSISNLFQADISRINPGINEAARAILRRKVSVLLVNSFNDFQVEEIIKLAKLKNIDVKEYNFKYYKAATIAEK